MVTTERERVLEEALRSWNALANRLCASLLATGKRDDIILAQEMGDTANAALRALSSPLRSEGEAATLRLALAWVDHHEPELVAEAEAKFGFKLTRDEAKAALSARPQPPQQPVAVKPLVWANPTGNLHEAAGVGSYYRIQLARNDKWILAINHLQTGTLLPSIDHAKAVAQADYETRIRSALYAAPLAQPVADEGEIESLQVEHAAESRRAEYWMAQAKLATDRLTAAKDAGVNFVFDALAEIFDIDWRVVEGSEDWGQDVKATLWGILSDASVIDLEEGERIVKRLPGPDKQLDRVFIGGGEYVRADEAIRAIEAANARAAQPVETAGERETAEINDELAVLERLAAGDAIAYSRDGDNSWFTKGGRAWVGDVVIGMRQKGYLRRVYDADDDWGHDVISQAGRDALALRPPLTQPKAEEAGK